MVTAPPRRGVMRPTARMTGALLVPRHPALRRRFGVGAAAAGAAVGGTVGATDPYGQASADLQTLVQAQLTVGDTANTAGTYPAAITAYVAAGNSGATVVGPEIDLAGYPNVTQPWTQAAWQLNTALAAIGAQTTTATATDATSAQTLAYNMLTLYQGAIAAGQQAEMGGQSGTSAGAPAQVGMALLAPAIVLVGSAAGLLYAAWKGGALGKGRRR
jgi:hypothetical protein